MRYELVIFDNDGVLVDSEVSVVSSWSRWAVDHDLDPAEVLAAVPGRRAADTVALFVPPADVDASTDKITRYELEDVLWPEHAPAASDSALSSLLSKLRRALGPGALTGRAELRLALPEPLWVDIEALGDAVGIVGHALDERRWADAAAQARAALAIATEPFLAECDGPWVLERRREVEGLRLRALEALSGAPKVRFPSELTYTSP